MYVAAEVYVCIKLQLEKKNLLVCKTGKMVSVTFAHYFTENI